MTYVLYGLCIDAMCVMCQNVKTSTNHRPEPMTNQRSPINTNRRRRPRSDRPVGFRWGTALLSACVVMGSTTFHVASAQERAAARTVEQDTRTGAGESVEDDVSGVKVVADQHVVGYDPSLANADVVQPGSTASEKEAEEMRNDDDEQSTDAKPDRPAVWGSASSNGVGAAATERAINGIARIVHIFSGFFLLS